VISSTTGRKLNDTKKSIRGKHSVFYGYITRPFGVKVGVNSTTVTATTVQNELHGIKITVILMRTMQVQRTTPKKIENPCIQQAGSSRGAFQPH
jgi:hypothetical protein